MKNRCFGLLLALLAIGCGPTLASRDKAPVPPEPVAPERLWAEKSFSPQPLDATPAAEVARVYQACGAPDQALQRAAERLAIRAQGGGFFDVGSLHLELRAAGAPYLWPRQWQTKLPNPDIAEHVQAWVERTRGEGQTRCGVARTHSHGAPNIVAVVAAETSVDVEPFPTRARVGQWLTFGARLRGVVAPELFIQGPRGRPRQALLTVRDDELTARFSLSEPGAWTVQLIAAGRLGPLPAAEALVFADREPSNEGAWPLAPGEAANTGAGSSDSDRLLAMLNGARQSEGLRALARLPELDAIAQAHAASMRDAQTLAHNLGNGGAEARLREARVSVELQLIGENVATAASLGRVHRLLWHSPSHRFTLLRPDFDAIGVGVAYGADGRVWTSQLFGRTK